MVVAVQEVDWRLKIAEELTKEVKQTIVEVRKEDWTMTKFANKAAPVFYIGWSPKVAALLTEYGLFKAYFRRFHLKEVDVTCNSEEGGTRSRGMCPAKKEWSQRSIKKEPETRASAVLNPSNH